MALGATGDGNAPLVGVGGTCDEDRRAAVGFEADVVEPERLDEQWGFHVILVR